MNPERRSSPPRARCVLCCVLVLAALASSGCRFVADEFTVLYRAAPGTGTPPDAPVTAVDAPR